MRKIRIPKKLEPVFTGPALYRGAYGGRGSGKTASFAAMAALGAILCAYSKPAKPGVIVCGREFQNTLADSSLAEVKLTIQANPWMLDYLEVGENYIRTRNGLVDFAFIGLRRNIQSIKSMAKIRLLWIDEAEHVSEESLEKADDTVRESGAEVWATWNPERKGSPIDKRFRTSAHPDAKVVELNWRDNPWFPETLDKKRIHCKENNPEGYDHIWEGGYVVVKSGAYFAKQLQKCREEGRIGHYPPNKMLSFRAWFDIGGTGSKADHTSIWITQHPATGEIFVVDHYEAQGQELSAHVNWMRSRGYDEHNTNIYLPHDGINHDRVFSVSYEGELRNAGYWVETIKNQGQGAAMQRVEAMRRVFPKLFFHKANTEAGIDALSWYHPRIDENRQLDLGPEHDWSSHSCDAIGMMAIKADEMLADARPKRVVEFPGNWMG